jgi:hypothetical protein
VGGGIDLPFSGPAGRARPDRRRRTGRSLLFPNLVGRQLEGQFAIALSSKDVFRGGFGRWHSRSEAKCFAIPFNSCDFELFAVRYTKAGDVKRAAFCRKSKRGVGIFLVGYPGSDQGVILFS